MGKQRDLIYNKLEKIKPSPPSADEVFKGFQLIKALTKEYQTLTNLAIKLEWLTKDVLKSILIVRRDMLRFQNPTGRYFIVGDKDTGYKLTSTMKDIRMLKRKMMVKHLDTGNILLNIELCILNNKN